MKSYLASDANIAHLTSSLHEPLLGNNQTHQAPNPSVANSKSSSPTFNPYASDTVDGGNYFGNFGCNGK